MDEKSVLELLVERGRVDELEKVFSKLTGLFHYFNIFDVNCRIRR